jgi:hypothetical protein
MLEDRNVNCLVDSPVCLAPRSSVFTEAVTESRKRRVQKPQNSSKVVAHRYNLYKSILAQDNTF